MACDSRTFARKTLAGASLSLRCLLKTAFFQGPAAGKKDILTVRGTSVLFSLRLAVWKKAACGGRRVWRLQLDVPLSRMETMENSVKQIAPSPTMTRAGTM